MAETVFFGVSHEILFPAAIGLAAIIVIILVWLATRRPKAAELFAVDALRGSLKVFPDADLEVTLQAFKFVPGKKSFGFDVLVKNRGELIEKLVLVMDCAKAVFYRVGPGELAIRSLEIRRDKKKIGKMIVSIACVPEREGLVSEIMVPMNEVLAQLQKANRISVIRAEGAKRVVDRSREREAIARDFEDMLAARKAPEKPLFGDTVEMLEENLRELAEEEKQAQLSYLRREINDSGFGDVVKKIQSKRIEARAKLARLKGK
jgi:hypothetical protein